MNSIANRMIELLKQIQSHSDYLKLIDEISQGEKTLKLGLIRSARLPLVAAIQSDLGKHALILSHRRDRALSHFADMELWTGNTEGIFFSEPSALFYENAEWSETAKRERLNGFARLIYQSQIDQGFFVCTSARALMARTLPRNTFEKASFQIKEKSRLEPMGFSESLSKIGYESAHSVTALGQFARRGGIIDLWPMQSDHPLRLEFFGDEVESLRTFDPASQRTISKVQSVLIPPAREYLQNRDLINLEDGQALSEFHIPLLHPESGNLIDFFPEDGLIFIDDRQALIESINEFDEQAIALRRQEIENGNLDSDFPIPYFTATEIEEFLESRTVIELGPAQQIDRHAISKAFRLGRRFGGRLKDLNEAVENFLVNGDVVSIFSRQAVRLRDIWDEGHFDYPEARPTFQQSTLGEGWSFQKESGQEIHLLTDGEIFGWDKPQIRRRPRVQKSAPESSYLDLATGEIVVHIDHGIGIFKGLVKRIIEGVEREFLQVTYGGDDQLYVPVHQADRITRYVGARSENPKLSRLGGVEWRTVKSRVKESVEAIAEDLLELYARRETVSGYQFKVDGEWQKELEAAFPYIETVDQLRVIEEVKADMESARPMDRLVCGDAGYGKTEVALRAAFKAVMDGKQVALLVPTTVLAQQHFDTFQKRLAAFPVRVEMLSRFRTAKEQKAIIKELASGETDIVIGTHRMLQKDVDIKDLGLLIIDEEQRFGVTHKEFLKTLRTEVDVLTMTATPIPRTLYMALTGVRDISTISTPPEERLPVVTHVGPYSQNLIRQAILRELDRGGQVFFVHNRVQTIGAMKSRLSKLMPEAKIVIAHGQMAENELAKRMQDFTKGEIDVLLTTTIIESGLDIPNANTLIIDRADTFGLAQLYQLRGRVGRGAQRAYAYFFKHPQRPGTDEGRQRLETIAENNQLGAGFSVAMRDLEIRGAGDLLGMRQHGLIASVGFHLYTRLLTKAVEDIRKSGALGIDKASRQLTLYHPMINVDLPLEVGIPDTYVPDKVMRLKLYRRLADLHDLSEMQALEEEFNDRFGQLPEESSNLLFQLRVKVMAEKAGLISISREGGRLALRFPQPGIDEVNNRQFPILGKNVRSSKNTIWIFYESEDEWKNSLIETLGALNASES